MKIALVVAVMLAALSGRSFAEDAKTKEGFSLKDKVEIRKHEERLQKAGVARLEKHCGKPIKVVVEWKTFVANFTPKYRHNHTVSFCEAAVDAVSSICGEPEGKESVAEGVKEVRCAYDAGVKKNDAAATLDKGVLRATYNWESSNVQDKVKEHLLKSL